MSVVVNPRSELAPPHEEDSVFFLEQSKRLSESLVWQVQRSFFEGQGIEAWRGGAVPHYITSNPYIGHVYARLVLAYLRDSSSTLNRQEPLYVVELGSGCGKFAYYFLRELEQLRQTSSLTDLRITYVMTDFASSNIEAWRTHPLLRPMVEAGLLDFAEFDAAQRAPLQLLVSGTTLSEGTVGNPLVLIANYVFDCIPHDVFRIECGRLHEGRVTTTSTRQEPDFADPEILSRIELAYEYAPVEGAAYGVPELDDILAEYRRELGDVSLLFPVAALECLRYFERLAGGQVMVLCADKGFHWEDDVLTGGYPGMVRHGGCFSMSVNFDALARYLAGRGGRALFATRRYTSLTVAAFLMGVQSEDYVATRETFADSVERFGPDEYASLVSGLGARADTMTADEILAWLRLSRGDVSVLMALLPALADLAASTHDAFREDLFAVLRDTLANDFDLGDGTYLDFSVGTLLYAFGYYPEARDLLQRGMSSHGPDTASLYNLGLCHWAMGQMETALDCLQRLLAADPDCQEAKALRIKLEGAILRRPRVDGLGTRARSSGPQATVKVDS